MRRAWLATPYRYYVFFLAHQNCLRLPHGSAPFLSRALSRLDPDMSSTLKSGLPF